MTLLRVVQLYGFTPVEPETMPLRYVFVAQLSMNLGVFGHILLELSCIV